jgi:hypothetical protein
MNVNNSLTAEDKPGSFNKNITLSARFFLRQIQLISVMFNELFSYLKHTRLLFTTINSIVNNMCG